MKNSRNPRRRKCHCARLGCIDCRRQVQTSFANATVSLLGDGSGHALLTLVPVDGVVDFDDLTEFDLKAFVRRHYVKLARRLPTDITFVGAVDVSLNYRACKPLNWSFHFHAILDRKLTKPELKPLRASYPIDRKKGIHKPVMVVKIKEGDLKQTAEYVCKSFFLKRSQFRVKPTSDRNPYLDSRSSPMNRREQEALETFLNQHSVTASIILIGTKRIQSQGLMKFRFKEIRQ